jgi:hypothetical protein
MLLWDIQIEITTEGFRDKIFNTKIVAALGRALSDTDYMVTGSAVEFFSAATAQGAFH